MIGNLNTYQVVTAFITELTDRLSLDSFDGYASLLSQYEQSKIARFVNWQDAHLSLFGKLLLMRGLNERGYREDKIMSIEQTDYRRPYFRNGPNFNISHAGRFVICVISDEKVGVDIEEIRPIDITNFRTCWTSSEWNEIRWSKNPLLEFYRFWTRKEAVIKADGRGMYLNLQTVKVSTSPVTIDEDTWFLSDLDVCHSYSCSIASAKEPTRPIQKQFCDFYQYASL